MKKYRTLNDDLIETLQNFNTETAQYLGSKLYKVRLRSSDIPKGKNKSFRLILFLFEIKRTLVPITIYFKGDRSDISEKEIEYHLAMVLTDIQQKKFLSR
ncbi:hypothetical protein HY624_01630 [Candidatus Uhrbacteria bacterium]|nr:hypothetical protein [Candidatus Uhrbacteria bacterium]